MRESIFPPEWVVAWLESKGIGWDWVEAGRAVWPPGRDAHIVLEMDDIEALMMKDDPMLWAFGNLKEREGVQDPEDADKWFIEPGDPWKLFPIQADLARVKGNVIVECGSEVGKTRDIVLGSLMEADYSTGGDLSLVAGNMETTLEEIWTEIEYQVEMNPKIGGGFKKKPKLKPYREMVFKRGFALQMRICGHDGRQFRGAHVSRTIRADEAALWKNPRQWSELWRAAMPGVSKRIYSTPDGDGGSPFFSMCARAVPVGTVLPKERAGEDPRFQKINIRKDQLPYPFWSEERAAAYREEYGGEQSLGWYTNVLGQWGSPQSSVFPMYLLEPLLTYLPNYRAVFANVDHETRNFTLISERLMPGNEAQVIEHTKKPLLGYAQIAEDIAAVFPSPTDLIAPMIICGLDPGSAQDPCEFIFVRVVEKKWSDYFRLHLQGATWPEIAKVIIALDHVSLHRVLWSVDSGSGGNPLIQELSENVENASCPYCNKPIEWTERLEGHGFGEGTDEIDIDTGEPILNPDKKDKHDNMMPYRLSNKEFGTRILERKMHKKQMEIAHDGGGGVQKLACAQLMTSHTALRTTQKGERVFKGTDDHLIDARRQVALRVAAHFWRNRLLNPTTDLVKTLGGRRSAYDIFEGGGVGRVRGGVSEGLGSAFGGGGVKRGLW